MYKNLKLKPSVKKSLSLIVASLLCASGAAQSQTNKHTREIEEVVVSASPLNKSRDAITQPAATLSAAALKQATAATLGETLQSLPGVSSASFGPGVGLPIIRGQSDNRVKVMQDSIGTMDAASASPDHAVTLEPLLASRIEVLRGPAALRYGSGAIGGLVNVLDKRIPEQLPDELEGGLEVRHADVNHETTGVATVTGGAGNIAWHLDGSQRRSSDLSIPSAAAAYADEPDETTQGYIANTDAQSRSNTLGLSYISEDGFIGIAINKMDNNYGIPPGAHGHHEEEHEETDLDHEEELELVRIDLQQTRTDLKGELNNPIGGLEKISLRLGHNDYEHTEMENGAPGTRFTNNAWEGRLEVIHIPLGAWRGAFGLQASERTFAAIGEEAFIPKSDISNLGVFIVEETNINDWTFELGARTETQQISPEASVDLQHHSLNLSSSVIWHFSDAQRLSLGIAQAERAPSVEELLANGPHPATGSYLLGDANLHPETSRNLELGYHWHSDWVQSSINLFYNQIGDFIYSRATGQQQDELTEFAYTQADATFSGYEAELNIALNDHWAWRLFSDAVNAQLDNTSGPNKYLPRIPPQRLGSGLAFEQNNWRGNINYSYSRAQNHPGENELPSAGFTRLDANLSYQVEQGGHAYEIFMKGTNLLNAEIRNAASFLRRYAPEAGRGMQIGVRITF